MTNHLTQLLKFLFPIVIIAISIFVLHTPKNKKKRLAIEKKLDKFQWYFERFGELFYGLSLFYIGYASYYIFMVIDKIIGFSNPVLLTTIESNYILLMLEWSFLFWVPLFLLGTISILKAFLFTLLNKEIDELLTFITTVFWEIIKIYSLLLTFFAFSMVIDLQGAIAISMVFIILFWEHR